MGDGILRQGCVECIKSFSVFLSHPTPFTVAKPPEPKTQNPKASALNLKPKRQEGAPVSRPSSSMAGVHFSVTSALNLGTPISLTLRALVWTDVTQPRIINGRTGRATYHARSLPQTALHALISRMQVSPALG